MSGIKKNIASLYVVQFVNNVLPLMTFPYLVRVLGVGGFGTMTLVMSICQYFVVFTEFGFNLSATKDVSINRDKPEVLGEIVASVLALKSLFMVISAMVLGLVCIVFPQYQEHAYILACGFLMVVGNVIYPGWFFQGMERMPFVTLISSLPKVLCTISIFVFVHDKDDIAVATLIQSAGAFVGGLIGLCLVFKIIGLNSLRIPSMERVYSSFHNGKFIFASQVSAILLNGSHVIILGYFSGVAAVGYYSVAEKLIKAANNIQVPICNSIYPRMAKKFASDKAEAMVYLLRVIKLFAPLMIFGSMTIFFMSDYITKFLIGYESEQISLLMKIMAVIPCSVFLDNIFGTQILLNNNQSVLFMRGVLISAAFGLTLSVIFVPMFGYVASATIYTLTQLTLLCVFYLMARQTGILQLWRKK